MSTVVSYKYEHVIRCESGMMNTLYLADEQRLPNSRDMLISQSVRRNKLERRTNTRTRSQLSGHTHSHRTHSRQRSPRPTPQSSIMYYEARARDLGAAPQSTTSGFGCINRLYDANERARQTISHAGRFFYAICSICAIVCRYVYNAGIVFTHAQVHTSVNESVVALFSLMRSRIWVRFHSISVRLYWTHATATCCCWCVPLAEHSLSCSALCSCAEPETRDDSLLHFRAHSRNAKCTVLPALCCDLCGQSHRKPTNETRSCWMLLKDKTWCDVMWLWGLWDVCDPKLCCSLH